MAHTSHYEISSKRRRPGSWHTLGRHVCDFCNRLTMDFVLWFRCRCFQLPLPAFHARPPHWGRKSAARMPDMCAVAFHCGPIWVAQPTPVEAYFERYSMIFRHRQCRFASQAQVPQMVCALFGVWLLISYSCFVALLPFGAIRFPRKTPTGA